MTKYQRCDVGSDSIKCESMSNWADTMQFQTGSKQVKILFPGRTDPQNVSLLGRVLTLPRQLTWRAQSGPHHSWCLFSFYYFFCQDGNDQDKMAAKCRTLGKLSITQKGRRTLGHLYTSVIHQAKYKSFVLHQCINTPPNHCSHNTRTKSRSKEKKFAINKNYNWCVSYFFIYNPLNHFSHTGAKWVVKLHTHKIQFTFHDTVHKSWTDIQSSCMYIPWSPSVLPLLYNRSCWHCPLFLLAFQYQVKINYFRKKTLRSILGQHKNSHTVHWWKAVQK